METSLTPIGKNSLEDHHLKVVFEEGEVILEAGENSDALYLLEEGEIDVVKNGRVLASIKDPRTFFGEMSFLTKNKRTATLRAKTRVVAYHIDQCAENTFESRLASASISLMKVMATRLDIVNREARRMEPYQKFHSAMKELCGKNKELKDLFKLVENEVDIQEENERDNLLSRYLTTPWIWSRLENAIFDILKHYLEEDLKVQGVESWQAEPLMGAASGIEFEGDKNGLLVIDLDPNLAMSLQQSMGIEEGDYRQEMAEEMNNLILGQLKRLVKERSIQLKTPVGISDQNHLKEVLGGEPALKIEVSCSKGCMRLIYQLEVE